MNISLKGLYVKEWKMMRGFFIGQFVIGIIIFFISDLGSQDLSLLNLIDLMALGFIILPGSVLFSLNMEANQLELFLHNPQSIHKLLFVKITNGILFTASYLFLLISAIVGVNLVSGGFSISNGELLLYLFYFSLQLMIIMIYPTMLLFLLWAIHQVWRTYIRGFSILLIICLLLAFLHGIEFVSSTKLYQALTQWGKITIPAHEGFQSFFIIPGLGSEFFVGWYVFYGVLSITLYFIAAYLLDRKVEV